MATTFDLLTPGDKPALLALTSPEAFNAARSALLNLNYKIHAAETHEECIRRYAQFQYQVVVIEEGFSGTSPDNNLSLRALQNMPMVHRRHSTVFLLGASFRTLDPLQAFQASVHAVVNYVDLPTLPAILQKVISENEVFLALYRDAQIRQAHGH